MHQALCLELTFIIFFFNFLVRYYYLLHLKADENDGIQRFNSLTKAVEPRGAVVAPLVLYTLPRLQLLLFQFH